MKQEDIDLLFKDLSSRLPYGVIVKFAGYSGREDCTLNVQHLSSTYSIEYLRMKPYLRPLSSMTEEEKEELKTLFDAEEVTSDSICYLEGGTLVEYLSRISYSFCSEIVDWLNEHHFDHHNLIEKGLALEASSEMYKKGE